MILDSCTIGEWVYQSEWNYLKTIKRYKKKKRNPLLEE